MLGHAASAAIDYATADPRAAVNGVTRAAGRITGMGGADLSAVQAGGFPPWTWFALGSLGGFLLGVWVASRHSDKLPGWLPGRSAD